MIAFISIIIAAIITAFVYCYEQYQKKMFIAKIVDGQKIDQKFISKEAELVIAQLRDRNTLKPDPYTSRIILPDGQLISYRFDDPIRMQKDSTLNFVPSEMEWEIFRGIIKKLLG